MHLRMLSWVAALVVLLGSVVVPAAAFAPPQGAVFNIPRPWGTSAERSRIVRTVEAAMDATRPTAADPKPVILVTTFLLDRVASVDAMVAACRRGVAVRVIIDEDIETRLARRLITVLNGDNVPDADGDGVADRDPRARRCNRPLRDAAERPSGARTSDDGAGELLDVAAARTSVTTPTEDSVTWGKDGSYVKVCDGSCRGAGGNMHSKFYAFSHTGTSDNVVMVSSSNLNLGGMVLGWNDLYVMRERPKGFAAYRQIHREMTDDTRAGDGKVEVVDGPYVSRFFPMRRARRSNDPTLRDLNRIRCTSAVGRTQIHVSMFYWKGVRGNYLADKLLSLARNGCSVSIIYGAPSVQIAERLRTAARAGTIALYDSRWDFDLDGFNEVRTHAKYLTVRGTVGLDRSAYQVWTGSANWVAGSLSRSDELTLNINLRSAYADYRRDWAMIRNHSRRLPYH